MRRHVTDLTIYEVELMEKELTHLEALAICLGLEAPSCHGDTFEPGSVERAVRRKGKPVPIMFRGNVLGYLEVNKDGTLGGKLFSLCAGDMSMGFTVDAYEMEVS